MKNPDRKAELQRAIKDAAEAHITRLKREQRQAYLRSLKAAAVLAAGILLTQVF